MARVSRDGADRKANKGVSVRSDNKTTNPSVHSNYNVLLGYDLNNNCMLRSHAHRLQSIIFVLRALLSALCMRHGRGHIDTIGVGLTSLSRACSWHRVRCWFCCGPDDSPPAAPPPFSFSSCMYVWMGVFFFFGISRVCPKRLRSFTYERSVIRIFEFFTSA